MLIRWQTITILAVTCALGAGPGVLPAQAGSTAWHDSPVPSAAAHHLIAEFQHAWPVSRGQGVTVAVLSTGVDSSLPGLKGKVTTGPNYTGLTHPVEIDGSVVAGVVAGDAGLAPSARILSVRIVPDGNEAGATSFFNNADIGAIDGQGIRYAASHGAQVIFIDESIGGDPTTPLSSAVRYAMARGAVIVSTDDDYSASAADYHYPESLPGVIGVGAVQIAGDSGPTDGTRSSQNQSILVAGPNEPETEPGPDGQTDYVDGPEAAAAVVAAVAALVKSAFPHLSPALVGQAMALSASYRPAGGYDTTRGFGLVNPYGALQEAAQLSRAQTQAPVGQTVTARFRPGLPLPPVNAVPRHPAALAGYGATAAVGVLCFIAALVLWWRRRSRPAPAGSEQFAQAQ